MLGAHTIHTWWGPPPPVKDLLSLFGDFPTSWCDIENIPQMVLGDPPMMTIISKEETE